MLNCASDHSVRFILCWGRKIPFLKSWSLVFCIARWCKVQLQYQVENEGIYFISNFLSSTRTQVPQNTVPLFHTNFSVMKLSNLLTTANRREIKTGRHCHRPIADIIYSESPPPPRRIRILTLQLTLEHTVRHHNHLWRTLGIRPVLLTYCTSMLAKGQF